MLSSRRFRTILKNIVTLSIAAPSVGFVAAGCGGIDTDGFTPVSCTASGSTSLMTGLTPAEAADYIELRRMPDGGGDSGILVESTGTPCKTATDQTICMNVLAGAISGQGFRVGDCVDFCPTHILVVNKGDEVKVIDTVAGVKAFLAPVDTASEAVLVAAISGYTVSCNNAEGGGVRDVGSGFEVLATRITASCDPIEKTLYVLAVDEQGNVTETQSEVIESESGACIGRRPCGLLAQKAKGESGVGAYLASVAHLEAASVFAFENLEAELLHHGAPNELIEAARKARRDEVRHAKQMKEAAERYGGVVPSPQVMPMKMRSLEEIALDNAVEGCVRETFGALVGMWQSRFAQDPALRRVMRQIAADEARHAELSWAIDAWARTRLSSEAISRMEAAQKEAIAALSAEAHREEEPALVAMLGLPDRNASLALVAHFESSMPVLLAA